jgi:hypothetical protein
LVREFFDAIGENRKRVEYRRRSAFWLAVGKNRHLWLKKLGNERVRNSRPGIKIADLTGVGRVASREQSSLRR